MSDRTLSALDGRRVIQFTDYVREGERVDVFRSFEDAEEERGARTSMVVCRDGDDWWLEESA